MTNTNQKSYYSCFDIAKLCQQNESVVKDWIQAGKLSSIQIPGGHRRVSRVVLEKFLNDEKMTKPATWTNQEEESYRILVVEDDPDLLQIVGDLLRNELNVEVRTEDHGFSAGLLIASWHPDFQ